MMTQAQKDLWLKNLRSGEYNQTTSMLKDHKGYCCLGVLMYSVIHPGSPSPGYPPRDLIGSRDQETLIEMNYKYRCSFSRIADWIEENIIASDGADQGNQQVAAGDQEANGSQLPSN